MVTFAGKLGSTPWAIFDAGIGGSVKALAGPDVARLRATITRTQAVARGDVDGGFRLDNAGLQEVIVGQSLWSDPSGCNWWFGGGDCDAGGCVFRGTAAP